MLSRRSRMVLGRVRKRSVEVVEVVDNLAYLVAAEGVVLLADSGQELHGFRMSWMGGMMKYNTLTKG